jgi:two-component system nitrogen regulation response regulator NtrX
MFPSILIVDDEPTIIQSLGGLLGDEGYEIFSATNGYESLKVIARESPDLVLLDIWMPGMDGIETLREIKKAYPFLPVIIITGHGTIETAVKAIKLGAFDFIEKPLSIEKVIVGINNALNFKRLEEENRYLRKKTIEKHSISGDSPPIEELKKQIAVAAPTDAWILISGENGVGKELVARTIHQLSGRAEQVLITVNCATMADDSLEYELFGYEKGVFEGAKVRKRGKFEVADQGTLFLDEVGDMGLATQAKVLRVLQEGQFNRGGSGRTLSTNFRVIASTNKDLEREIERGNFREDLYYRLNVIPIDVPPLRERVEDIPVLVDAFLKASAAKDGQKLKRISPESLDLLGRYSWPGNVRELKNLVERLTIMVEGNVVEVGHIPSPYNPGAPGPSPEKGLSRLLHVERLEEARQVFQDTFVQYKLSQYQHDIESAAKAMGLAPAELQSLLPE